MTERRSAEEWANWCYSKLHTRPRLGPSTGLICPDCARAFAAQECAALQAEWDETVDELVALLNLPDKIVEKHPVSPTYEDVIGGIKALQQRVKVLETALDLALQFAGPRVAEGEVSVTEDWREWENAYQKIAALRGGTIEMPPGWCDDGEPRRVGGTG